MKKNLALILIGFAFIVFLVSLFFVNNKLNTIIDSLHNRTSSLEQKVNSLYSYIDSLEAKYIEEMKRQASLLEDLDISYGDFNPDDLTLAIDISLIPKSFSDNTLISITFVDEALPLTRENNHFFGTFNLKLLEAYRPYITIIEDGMSRNERLDEIDYSYLILSTGKVDMIEKISYINNKLTFANSTIYLMHYPHANSSIKEARLYAQVNDQEVYTKDITKNLEQEDDPYSYSYKFNQSFDLKSNDELIIYLDITETNGLKYQLFVFGLLFSKDAPDFVHISGHNHFIDKEGNKYPLNIN